MFEVKQVEPRGSAFKLNFVQCTNCGGVVGVMEYHNIGALIEKMQSDLERKLH
jgi:hypothetical protein